MKMRISFQLLQKAVGIVGLVLTYTSLTMRVVGRKMVGLEWEWWAIIGLTIFVIAIGSWLWRLENKDAKLTREERKLNIKNGLFDFWQKTLQSMVQMPDDLKKKIDEIDELE